MAPAHPQLAESGAGISLACVKPAVGCRLVCLQCRSESAGQSPVSPIIGNLVSHWQNLTQKDSTHKRMPEYGLFRAGNTRPCRPASHQVKGGRMAVELGENHSKHGHPSKFGLRLPCASKFPDRPGTSKPRYSATSMTPMTISIWIVFPHIKVWHRQAGGPL